MTTKEVMDEQWWCWPVIEVTLVEIEGDAGERVRNNRRERDSESEKRNGDGGRKCR